MRLPVAFFAANSYFLESADMLACIQKSKEPFSDIGSNCCQEKPAAVWQNFGGRHGSKQNF